MASLTRPGQGKLYVVQAGGPGEALTIWWLGARTASLATTNTALWLYASRYIRPMGNWLGVPIFKLFMSGERSLAHWEKVRRENVEN